MHPAFITLPLKYGYSIYQSKPNRFVQPRSLGQTPTFQTSSGYRSRTEGWALSSPRKGAPPCGTFGLQSPGRSRYSDGVHNLFPVRIEMLTFSAWDGAVYRSPKRGFLLRSKLFLVMSMRVRSLQFHESKRENERFCRC